MNIATTTFVKEAFTKETTEGETALTWFRSWTAYKWKAFSWTSFDLEKVRVESIEVRKEFGKQYGNHI